MTIVIVEHRVDVAWPIADRVLALGPEGRPIDVGRPAEVLARSRDRLEAAGTWLPDDDDPRRPRRTHIRVRPPVRAVLTAHGVSFAYDGPTSSTTSSSRSRRASGSR